MMQKKSEAKSVATASRLMVIIQFCSLPGGAFGVESGVLPFWLVFNIRKPPLQIYFSNMDIICPLTLYNFFRQKRNSKCRRLQVNALKS